jgi:Big-like domain-containing protein
MSTMLHEALHNLTKKDDSELEQALGLKPDTDCGTSTICISQKLADNSCAPDLISIAISPQNSSTSVGGKQQFSALGKFSDQSTQDLTSLVSWESSSSGKATVNNSGLATGVASGKTKITAIFGAVSASTKLTIN